MGPAYCIAEAGINHLKQMTSAVMLAAMVPGGLIDGSFSYAAYSLPLGA